MSIATTFQNFLGVFQNFSVESIAAGLGSTFSLGIVVLVVFGLVECIFGWAVFHFELTISVFTAGCAVVCYSVFNLGFLAAYLTAPWMVYLFAVVVGLILAGFTWNHKKLALLLIMLGVAFGLLFLIISLAIKNRLIALILAAVFSIPLAFLTRQVLLPAIIAITSLGGAFVVAVSLAGFLNSLIPYAGPMIIADLTVVGLVAQVRRILKSKVDSFMQSANSFLFRYEQSIATMSRDFFSRGKF